MTKDDILDALLRQLLEETSLRSAVGWTASDPNILQGAANKRPHGCE